MCTDPIRSNADPISRCFLYFGCLSSPWKSHALSLCLSWINDFFSWGHLEREKLFRLLGMQGVSKGCDLLHRTTGKFSSGHCHYMIHWQHWLLPGIYFATEDDSHWCICISGVSNPACFFSPVRVCSPETHLERCRGCASLAGLRPGGNQSSGRAQGEQTGAGQRACWWPGRGCPPLSSAAGAVADQVLWSCQCCLW